MALKEVTLEVEVDGADYISYPEVEFDTAYESDPGNISGPPEDCWPPSEDFEVSITDIDDARKAIEDDDELPMDPVLRARVVEAFMEELEAWCSSDEACEFAKEQSEQGEPDCPDTDRE